MLSKEDTNVDNSQEAQTYLTQQFSSTCDVSCQDVATDISEKFVRTKITGGVNITQTCSSDASCITSSSSDGVVDTEFKGQNSANTTPGGFLDFESTNMDNAQTIRSTINQQTNEDCEISSYSEISDVTIQAYGSDISGGVNISQDSSASGECQMENIMSFSGKTLGISNNNISSGKNKKAYLFQALTYIGIAFAVIFGIYLISSVFSGKKNQSTQTPTMMFSNIPRPGTASPSSGGAPRAAGARASASGGSRPAMKTPSGIQTK